MKKYVIRQRLDQVVEIDYVVQADSLEDALETFGNEDDPSDAFEFTSQTICDVSGTAQTIGVHLHP